MRDKSQNHGSEEIKWHALNTQDVFLTLDAHEEGLSPEEAARRLERYGPNRLPPPEKRGPVRRFLVQFHNLLIYVLLCAAVITALLGHWLDCGVILGVVLVNALIGKTDFRKGSI